MAWLKYRWKAALANRVENWVAEGFERDDTVYCTAFRVPALGTMRMC